MRLMVLAALGLLAACRQPADDQAGNAAGNTATAPAEANSAVSLPPPPATREAALKLMHDRHEDMERIGKATKATSRTLKAGSPDLAVIRTSAATIAELAPQIPSWFPFGTGPDIGKTYAKAEVWQKPEDFAAKSRDFHGAARAFDAAARAGELDAIRARFGDLGKSCKACHELYRAEHEH